MQMVVAVLKCPTHCVAKTTPVIVGVKIVVLQRDLELALFFLDLSLKIFSMLCLFLENARVNTFHTEKELIAELGHFNPMMILW